MARKTVETQEGSVGDATVERLQRATSAIMAASLGSAGAAMVLIVLGPEDTALLLATSGLALGAPLGAVLALVTEGLAWRVERRRRAAPRL